MTTFSLQDQDLFRRQAYIGGRWCDADSGATLDVNNPATGEILGTVPMMGANETRRAIEAAKDAFVDWRHKPAKERSILLRRWHDLIMANVEDLGALMTAEQGKPVTEAKGEVAYAASFIEWFAEEAKRVYGDTIPSPWNDRRLVVIKQPIGHDHAKSWAGVGFGLYHGRKTSKCYPVFGLGTSGLGRTRWYSRRGI
jgi:succinate-semialdehyde dehydrogenase/glutarate-semialdehyde dehydrogenase